MELAKVPIANPATVFQEGEDGWAVLVNLDVVSSLALNPTGIVVWKLVNGRRTIADIVDKVEKQFDEVPNSVTEDVVKLVKDLADDGFIGYEWTGD